MKQIIHMPKLLTIRIEIYGFHYNLIMDKQFYCTFFPYPIELKRKQIPKCILTQFDKEKKIFIRQNTLKNQFSNFL